MDNLLAKIPLLGDKILRELDNQSLVKFREAKKSWQSFIDQEKIIWLRIIQKCIGNGDKFSTEWTTVLTKAPQAFLMHLSISAQKYHRKYQENQFSYL